MHLLKPMAKKRWGGGRQKTGSLFFGLRNLAALLGIVSTCRVPIVAHPLPHFLVDHISLVLPYTHISPIFQ